MVLRNSLQKFCGMLVLAAVAACTIQEKDIAGQWQATAFYENGQTLTVPLDSVKLVLTPEGGYAFSSLGFYRESGTYRVSIRYLFLTDTTVQPAVEHILKVLYVSEDTLKIRMSRQGQEQVLFLAKQK